MTEHPSLEDLALFVYGNLPDPSDIEKHIDECPDCAAEVVLGREMRYMDSLGLISRSSPSESTDLTNGKESTEFDEKHVMGESIPDSHIIEEGGGWNPSSKPPTSLRFSTASTGKASIAGRMPITWMAIAATVLLLLGGGVIVTSVLAVRSTHELDAARTEANELRAQLSHLKSGEQIPLGPGIEFHVDKTARTPARVEIWKANYQPNDPPAENLRRIYAASDHEIKEFIDQMRKSKKPDFEILTAVRLRFGPAEGKP